MRLLPVPWASVPLRPTPRDRWHRMGGQWPREAGSIASSSFRGTILAFTSLFPQAQLLCALFWENQRRSLGRKLELTGADATGMGALK